MGVVEDIRSMQKEGKSENEIKDSLVRKGYTASEITEGLSQIQIKEAVSNSKNTSGEPNLIEQPSYSIPVPSPSNASNSISSDRLIVIDQPSYNTPLPIPSNPVSPPVQTQTTNDLSLKKNSSDDYLLSMADSSPQTQYSTQPKTENTNLSNTTLSQPTKLEQTTLSPPQYSPQSTSPYNEYYAGNPNIYQNQSYNQNYYSDYPSQENADYEQYYAEGEYQPYQEAVSSDIITEVAEQVVSEKLAYLQDRLERALDFRTVADAKISSIDERLIRIEKIMDRLQLSLLQRVGEYISDVGDIKKELIETQKSFKALLPQLRTAVPEEQENNMSENQNTKSNNFWQKQRSFEDTNNSQRPQGLIIP